MAKGNNRTEPPPAADGGRKPQGVFSIPREAETKADVGFFLVGAALGGGLDAVLNAAGFAEPLIFATLCGSGALGAKKLADAWIEGQGRREPPS